MSLKKNIHLLVFGTDPVSKGGGIACALPAFFSALESVNINYNFIPTHFAGTVSGKWWPWIKSFYLTLKILRAVKLHEYRTVAYIHIGGGYISFIRKYLLARYLNLLSIPVVLQIHGPHTERHFTSSFRKYLLIHWYLDAASAIAVLTPWCAKLLAQNSIIKTVHVVPNTLSDALNDIANTPRSPLPARQYRTILAMSRLVKGKGFELIVEALPYLPKGIIVEIAGAGSLQPCLESRIDELKQRDKVIFLGWLDDDEKFDAFCRADVFCLPSQNDSFGMGYIESMAHGVPVVALNYGPIPDVVPNKKCGIIIDKPDPVLLANAIIEILSKDSVQLGLLQTSSKRWVQDSFNKKLVGKKIQDICEVVL